MAEKLNFIKEGQFEERTGSPTLKLIGNVVPVDKVEVVRHVRENLTRRYPLSAMELARSVKRELPSAGVNEVWQTIKEHDLKNNADYSAYNFRNKKQEDRFHETGEIPPVTPSIYNQSAVDFIVHVLKAGKRSES